MLPFFALSDIPRTREIFYVLAPRLTLADGVVVVVVLQIRVRPVQRALLGAWRACSSAKRFDYPCFTHSHLENKHSDLVYIYTRRRWGCSEAHQISIQKK